MHKGARGRSGTGIEIFIGTPNGEIDVPFVQGERDVSDRMREIDADGDSMLFGHGGDGRDVEQLPGKKIHCADHDKGQGVGIFFDQLGYDPQSIVPGIGKIGEALLQPHISYLKPLMPLVERRAIHAMAHITGGGLTDNVPRVLPEGMHASIRVGAWEVPELFRILQEGGEFRDRNSEI